MGADAAAGHDVGGAVRRIVLDHTQRHHAAGNQLSVDLRHAGLGLISIGPEVLGPFFEPAVASLSARGADTAIGMGQKPDAVGGDAADVFGGGLQPSQKFRAEGGQIVSPRVAMPRIAGQLPVEQAGMAGEHVAHSGPVQVRWRRPDQRQVQNHQTRRDLGNVADPLVLTHTDRIGESGVDRSDGGNLDQRLVVLPRQELGGVHRRTPADAHHGAAGVRHRRQGLQRRQVHVACHHHPRRFRKRRGDQGPRRIAHHRRPGPKARQHIDQRHLCDIKRLADHDRGEKVDVARHGISRRPTYAGRDHCVNDLTRGRRAPSVGPHDCADDH